MSAFMRAAAMSGADRPATRPPHHGRHDDEKIMILACGEQHAVARIEVAAVPENGRNEQIPRSPHRPPALPQAPDHDELIIAGEPEPLSRMPGEVFERRTIRHAPVIVDSARCAIQFTNRGRFDDTWESERDPMTLTPAGCAASRACREQLVKTQPGYRTTRSGKR